MKELTVQKEGTNWALGIVGNKKIDVIQRFDYFYHFKATNAKDLHWLRDDDAPFVGYFWTQEKKLKRSLRHGTLLEALNAGLGGDFKGKKGGLVNEPENQKKMLESSDHKIFFCGKKTKIAYLGIDIVYQTINGP